MTDVTDLRTQIGLLTQEDVAALCDVTPHTLAMWRSEKKGPSFVKLGRSIFYRRPDVETWVASSVVATVSEVDAA